MSLPNFPNNRTEAEARLRTIVPDLMPYIGRLLNIAQSGVSDSRRGHREAMIIAERFERDAASFKRDQADRIERLRVLDVFEEFLVCLRYLDIEQSAKAFAASYRRHDTKKPAKK